MRRIAFALLAVVTALVFAGCVSAKRTATYNARSDGTVSHGTLAAVDVAPGDSGPQEIIGFNLPMGPFSLKAGLIWDGTPVVINPTPLLAAPLAAPQTTKVKRTVMVPVTRMEAREVKEEVLTVPIPRTAPAPCEPPKAAPVDPCKPVGSLPDGEIECPDGACHLPAVASSK